MTVERPDVLVAAGGDIRARMVEALHTGGHESVLELGNVAEIEVVEFLGDVDRWRILTRSGREFGPRLLVEDRGMPPATCAGAIDPSLVPYHHVAWAGCPNYFVLEGPNVSKRATYISKCLSLMQEHNATRIDVRAGAHRAFDRLERSGVRGSNHLGGCAIRRSYHKRSQRPERADFDLSRFDERERDTEYSGAARLVRGMTERTVEVYLNGHFEPLDGLYHWYGRVHGDVDDLRRTDAGPLTITIEGGATAEARLEERDPWGHFRISGVGAPPFRLNSIEV